MINLPPILQTILSIGAVIAIISYAWGQWISGKNKYKIDTITLLEKDVKTLREEVINLTNEVTALRTAIAEKDEKLREWMEVFQGRDPKTQELLNSLNEYMLIGKPLIESVTRDVLPVVSKLDKFLNKQTF